ncbi:metallophosphoesterase [Spiribacter halobius]|uniref:Metallophosphoesterase n=1 Tax=Sediminicurvatus halobius TaxID=2182432 RepID=A0A2U2N262_9GAMM|nr:metallophosphoesterase [Spiribacter halobius]
MKREVPEDQSGERHVLDRIYIAGDPHGRFDPLNAAAADRPAAMLMLGDFDLDTALEVAVADARRKCDLWWIHGNHDVDRPAYYRNLFESSLRERCFSARVIEIGGVRFAGLGGVFQARIWHPHNDGGRPRYLTRAEYLAAVPPHERWLGGLPRKARAAIFWEDYEALWQQQADVLVTHEAPACHPYGFAVLDDLAEAMGAHTIIHGHHHVTYTYRYRNRPLTVHGVGLAGVRTAAGRVLTPGLDEERGTFELELQLPQRDDRPAGELLTINDLMPHAAS